MCDGGGGAPSSPSSLLLLRCCCWTSRDEKENCCHSLAWGVSGATPSLGLKWQTFRGAARAGRLRQNKAAWLNLAWTPPPLPLPSSSSLQHGHSLESAVLLCSCRRYRRRKLPKRRFVGSKEGWCWGECAWRSAMRGPARLAMRFMWGTKAGIGANVSLHSFSFFDIFLLYFTRCCKCEVPAMYS